MGCKGASYWYDRSEEPPCWSWGNPALTRFALHGFLTTRIKSSKCWAGGLWEIIMKDLTKYAPRPSERLAEGLGAPVAVALWCTLSFFFACTTMGKWQSWRPKVVTVVPEETDELLYRKINLCRLKISQKSTYSRQSRPQNGSFASC